MTKTSKIAGKHMPKGMVILHEDRDILVVDKEPGLLTVVTERGELRTACNILNDYVRKGCARSGKQVHVVHRLDRETSGVLVFAKTREAKLSLQSRWKDTEKKYIAVVHGRLRKRSDTISTYLVENDAYSVYSTSHAAKGKLSHTTYEVLKESGEYSLLSIRLLTGRKHQIRVHMADIGHPVVGDGKYGKKDGHKRLALHAISLSFNHPYNGRRLTFETDIPLYFTAMM